MTEVQMYKYALNFGCFYVAQLHISEGL